MPAESLLRVAEVRVAAEASLKLAHDAGARIGSGTDILGPDQNQRGLELVIKSRILGAMPAIFSATSTSAGVLRRPDLGVLAEGKTADVIAVDFDPADRVGVLA